MVVSPQNSVTMLHFGFTCDCVTIYTRSAIKEVGIPMKCFKIQVVRRKSAHIICIHFVEKFEILDHLTP